MRSILPYLNDLESIPRMPQKELLHTIELYRLTRSESARNVIIEQYLPLIPQLLLRYKGQGIPLPDLLQEANTRLIEIVSDLSPQIDDLRAYIIKSINNRILNVLRAQGNYTKLLSNIKNLSL